MEDREMRDMKARRRAAAALIGVLALAGLAACRADPAVAAYVDDVRITEAEVDQAVAERRAALDVASEEALAEFGIELDEQVSTDDTFTAEDAAAQLAEAEQQEAERLDDRTEATRDDVITMLILTEAITAHAEAEGLELPASDPQLIAEEFDMPADSSYVRLAAEFFAVRTALQGTLQPTPPSEADQREMYDNLIAQGVTGTFEEAQQVLTVEQVGGAVALRDLIVELVDRTEVRVNPRYDPTYQVLVSLGNVETWLSVPLTDSAVVDAG
jgi:hypothetical protein